MLDWIIQTLFLLAIEMIFGIAVMAAGDASVWITFLIIILGYAILEVYVEYRKKHDKNS